MTPLTFSQKSRLTVEINHATPLVRLHDAPRHASVIKLPARGGPHEALLTLPLTDERFLAARVDVYNADWQRQQQLALKDFHYQQPGALHGHQMTARLALKAPQAAWLVVYADSSQQPDRQQLLPGSTRYAEKSQTVPLLEQAQYARFSDQGSLTISLHNGQRTLGERGQSWTESDATPEPAWNDVVRHYQQAIAGALQQHHYREAAEIAERAQEAGYQEASAFLVEQMKTLR
jgi:maltose operon protein